MDEYNSLRAETAARVAARDQILSITLVFAASMMTLGLGKDGYHSALLVYPIVSLFFALGFGYNSLMLIEIGGYLRGLEARRTTALGWATYLKSRYGGIEPFEIASTSGLFVGTQLVALALYFTVETPSDFTHVLLAVLSVVALAGTIFAIVYPIGYHHAVLRRGEKPAASSP